MISALEISPVNLQRKGRQAVQLLQSSISVISVPNLQSKCFTYLSAQSATLSVKELSGCYAGKTTTRPQQFQKMFRRALFPLHFHPKMLVQGCSEVDYIFYVRQCYFCERGTKFNDVVEMMYETNTKLKVSRPAVE